MSKASLNNQLSSVNGTLALTTGKLSKLKEAKAKLNLVGTEVFDVVGDNANYHLKGKKYEEEKEDEDAARKTIQTLIKHKKKLVLDQLDAAITQAELQKTSLLGQVSTLTAALSQAKD